MREEMIAKIVSSLHPIDKEFSIVEYDVWVNDGDGDGEDIQLDSLGYSDGEFGAFVRDDDFIPFKEFSDEEIENLYDAMFG